jgi:fluoride ion exporter CrcB/FEX
VRTFTHPDEQTRSSTPVGQLKIRDLGLSRVGFCGALTTWSTFACEMVLLRRQPALYAGATLVVGVAAATVGTALG